jgi:hypothetical protein
VGFDLVPFRLLFDFEFPSLKPPILNRPVVTQRKPWIGNKQNAPAAISESLQGSPDRGFATVAMVSPEA